MLANTTNTAQNLTLTLPEGTTGTAIPVFADSPSGMTFNVATRVLSGKIKKQEVHVYQLDALVSQIEAWPLY